MKTIGNISSIAVYAAVATVLAACSANPVEDTNNKKAVVASKAVKKAPVKVAAASGKTVVKKLEVSKPAVSKPAGKKPSKAEALAKKKAIIAMAKARKIQAAAKARKAQAPIRVAKAVVKKPVYRKPATRVRSPQPVGVRSAQPVRARAVNSVVRARAPQPATSRALKAPVKYVAKRTQQKAVKRNVVQARPAVRVASNANSVKRAVYRKPAQPAYRKAVYRKPVVRRATPKRSVQRIDPSNSFGYALSNAAIERTKQRVRYDGRYLKIGYPWGDVPKSIGVCTDVVIRSYRRLGIDLQSEVHKDISKDFYAYPNLTKWGLDKPDPNIDHRRVYNLQAFFKRHKAELPRSRNPRDYKPGDLVTWMVGPTFPHIGVVVNKRSPSDPNRLMIAHNVGAGPVIEDILFRFPMTGHYRYTPKHRNVDPAMHFAKTPPPASVLRKRKQKQVSYAQLLQASKYLNATKPVTPAVDKQAKASTTKQPKLYLAQLDSVLASGSSNLNSAAVQALLKR